MVKLGPSGNFNSNEGKQHSGTTSVLAVGASFFGTPLFNDLTRDGVVEYSITHYGEWIAGIAQFGWFVLSATGIFFVSRSLLAFAFKYASIDTIMKGLKSRA